MSRSGFDYEELNIFTCTYSVAAVGGTQQEEDCGEPAVYKIWWSNTETMHVCQKHLDIIKESEVKDEKHANGTTG